MISLSAVEIYNVVVGSLCIPLNAFTVIIMYYLLHSDSRRRRPALMASWERQRALNTTMKIFLAYHAVTSATNVMCTLIYLAAILELPGSLEAYSFLNLRDFLCNLFIFLPQIVGGFVVMGKRLQMDKLHGSRPPKQYSVAAFTSPFCVPRGSVAALSLIISHG